MINETIFIIGTRDYLYNNVFLEKLEIETLCANVATFTKNNITARGFHYYSNDTISGRARFAQTTFSISAEYPTSCRVMLAPEYSEEAIGAAAALVSAALLITCCAAVICCVLFAATKCCRDRAGCFTAIYRDNFYNLKYFASCGGCADSVYVVDCYGFYMRVTRKNKHTYMYDGLYVRERFEELKMVKV